MRAVVNGVEQTASAAFTLPANAPTRQYLDPAADSRAAAPRPRARRTPTRPTTCRVGDLDGDGELEYVLKWDPTNAKDNSQSGYTGNVFLDAYKLNGTRLWRIDLGRNIRAGAHYTQFLVYDFDGDGRPRSREDRGRHAQRHGPGHRQRQRRSPQLRAATSSPGPEFLTVFNGQTGAVMATINYVPARGTVGRLGRHLRQPRRPLPRRRRRTSTASGRALIMARGYYTRAVIAAWDFRNGQLTQRWMFDCNSAGSAVRRPGQPQPVDRRRRRRRRATRSSSAP